MSASATSDVKIDPLRGKKEHDDSNEGAAVRAVFEESSHLFDLRRSKIVQDQIAKSHTDSDGNGENFHLRVNFVDEKSADEVSPKALIEECQGS